MKRGREEGEGAINVFIDLDGTLVSLVAAAQGEDIIELNKVCYKLAHGGRELLLALNNIPNVRINFYSFGRSSRNLSLSRLIVLSLPTKIPRYLLISPIAQESYSRSFPKSKKLRLSNEDLKRSLLVHEVVVEHEKITRVKELPQPTDMGNSILIDDRTDFVAAGEEANYIHVYTCDKNCQAAKFMRDNNLIRVLGTLLLAMKLSSDHSCSLVAALAAIQWDENGRFCHSRVNDMGIYELGLKEMKKFNPELELKGEPGEQFEDYLKACEVIRYSSFKFKDEPCDEHESAKFRLEKIASQRHPIQSSRLKP